MKKLLFWCAYLLIICISTFLVAEMTVRLLRPQMTYLKLKDAAGNFYAPSEFNPFTLRAEYHGSQPAPDDPLQRVPINTNRLGLRGREFETKELKSVQDRILILGDSYTFGVYVDDAQTYCAVLESSLRRRGKKVVVLNAGYADGYETDEQYCWLVNQGIAFHPTIIVLGLFAGNDIMGISPSTWVTTDRRGLPIKIKNPSLWIDDNGFLRSKTKDYKTAGVAFIYRLPWVRESHFLLFSYDLLRKIKWKSSWWYGEQGAGYVLKSYPHIFKLSDKKFDLKEKAFIRLLSGMRDVAFENGARFVVLMIPFNFQVEPDLLEKVFGKAQLRGGNVSIARDYYSELEAKLYELNIPFINVQKAMQSRPSEKYFPRCGEVHFNSNGYAFTANVIKEFLLKNS